MGRPVPPLSVPPASVPRPDAPAVLQVLPALDTGGVEQGTIEIARALRDEGWRALVASAGGRLVPSLEAAGGRHLPLPLATKDPVNIIRNAGKLTHLARAQGATLIHARSRAPAWSALVAARRAGLPFVTTYHAPYGEGAPGKRLYNSVMARGDRVIAISRYVAAQVMARHGTNPARIRLIPRGVDPARFDPAAIRGSQVARLAEAWRLPDGAPVVMLPARLTRWKGGLVLLEALARLARRDAVAVLVGSDQGRRAYAAELEHRARALGIADRVRIVGHCTDMPAALMLADAVVSASIEPEGFGRSVIEAQAMARPVIATNHGGAAETVEDGETGRLVPPGNAAALAAALDEILALPLSDRLALGARARAAVCARYTVAAMQEATLDVYRELL
jgi:glycosyltransferase involved in cell wall biosynthesis